VDIEVDNAIERIVGELTMVSILENPGERN